MNSSALGVILGVVSLAGIGVLYVKFDELADRVDSRREVAQRDGSESGDAWIRANKTGTNRVKDEQAYGDADVGGGDAENAGAPAETPSAREATLLERIKRLEEAQKDKPRSRMWHRPKFASSVEDLGKKLKLSPTQTDRMKDIVARGKQRVEDILSIPDETGKSPMERRKEQREQLMKAIADAKTKNNPGQVLSFASGMMNDRNKTIPGRNATYGEEIDRIQAETKKEMRDSLNVDQQKEFDNTHVDNLIGGGGGGMRFAMTAPIVHDDKGESGAEAIVIGGASIEMEVDEPSKKDDG